MSLLRSSLVNFSSYLRTCHLPASKTMWSRHFSVVGHFATVDPHCISEANPGRLENCVDGQWHTTPETLNIVDPLNGERFIISPNTQVSINICERSKLSLLNTQ